jgi:hypothetical protein
MKFIFDNTKSNYKYPINQSDLKLLFKLIPAEWKTGIKIVHFLGQEPTKTRFDRPVHKLLLSNKLNLSVIGLSEEEIVTEILIELRQEADNNTLRAVSYNSLTREQLKQIKEIIKPNVKLYIDTKDKEKRHTT